MKLKLLRSLWIFLLSPVLVFDNSSAVAQTSGCGSGSSWYLLRIGTPIAANQFRVACNEHDACYDTYGKSKQECDKSFHNRMLGICARDHNTILGRPLRIACNGRADVYYTGVLENAQDAYDKAQAAAQPSSSQSAAACSSTYDPRPYRPGTAGWNGRVGQIAFNNGTSASVKVTLFHPDAPARAFNSWNVQPGQNLFLGGDNYGMDWGIQVDGSPICIVGSVSDWNSFNGSQIFQTWVERVRR